MRMIALFAVTSPLLLFGCSREAETHAGPPNGAGVVSAPDVAGAPVPAQAGERWDQQSSDEGAVLTLRTAADQPTIRLYCQSRARRFLVNVSGFEPVGSEERLSIGSGSNAAVLVADTRGDAERGGVTGSGEIPANLEVLIAGPVAINYGAQNSGPHTAPPGDLARSFVTACTGRDTAAANEPGLLGSSANLGPCLMQDGEPLRVAPLRAIGTEPFWGARIEGRCVTYSDPEDQAGTRIWTRYVPSPNGGTWSGALGGVRFDCAPATRRDVRTVCRTRVIR